MGFLKDHADFTHGYAHDAAQAVKDAISGAFDTPVRPSDANPNVSSGSGSDPAKDLPSKGIEAIKGIRRRPSINPDGDDK